MMANKRKPVAPADAFNRNLRESITSPYTNRYSQQLRLSKADEAVSDELIGALSDSMENRRARQVFEWETARRNSAGRTA